MGCPRREQRVSTRDTQLNSIPAYHLCSCGYSRSLLRRSSLLYSMYAFVDTLTHCTSSASTQSNASGGGAPCVTAGDTRAKRGGTRGGSGQRTLRRRRRRTESVEGNSDVQKWAAVRHRRCRRFALSSVHGFALRASPAVKHGVSPPGTVGEHAVLLGRVDAIRVRADRIRIRAERPKRFSNTIRALANAIRM